MTNRKKHKTRILVPVVFLMMLSFVFLYVGGVYKIEKTAQEVSCLEKEVDQINTQGGEIRRQELILKEILPAQKLLKQYFINRDNIVDFTYYLEEISEKAGVVSKNTLNQTPGSLDFVISFEGSFENCLYFIALIESLPYNLVIEDVYVEQTHQDELWGGGMNVNFLGSGRD